MSDSFYNSLCVHQLIEGYEEGYKDGYEAGKRDAASPWHRVEEEPKESGKQYVVWASKGYAYCDKWLGDRWLISSVAPETVTYWMPIEPPKEITNE